MSASPRPGDILTYLEMCQIEGVNLQRGMNYRLKPDYSVILMSVRAGAPYRDEVRDDGRVLEYEGHDVARTEGIGNPKDYDQPKISTHGRPTQNGLFDEAARAYLARRRLPERVKVYEKLRSGLWVYNGIFHLLDSSVVQDGRRKVFRFRLEFAPSQDSVNQDRPILEHNRLIPSSVKAEVWKRDGGRCVVCGATDNLHFDHIIPFSKGGSSLLAENIQLMCARHNLAKRDRIE